MYRLILLNFFKGGFKEILGNTFLLGHTFRKQLESENGKVESEDDTRSMKTSEIHLLRLSSLPVLWNKNWPSSFLPLKFAFTKHFFHFLRPFWKLNKKWGSQLYFPQPVWIPKKGKAFPSCENPNRNYSCLSLSIEIYGKLFRICFPTW